MPHLVLDNLSAHYGALQVLDKVNLSIAKGEVIGLMGPSGSGKSSILRVLMGLTPKSGGTVQLDDEEVLYDSPQSLKRMRE